jgi:hypothetical protein
MREAFASQLAEFERRIDGQLKLAIATLARAFLSNGADLHV